MMNFNSSIINIKVWNNAEKKKAKTSLLDANLVPLPIGIKEGVGPRDARIWRGKLQTHNRCPSLPNTGLPTLQLLVNPD